jgi:hypothetical protein
MTAGSSVSRPISPSAYRNAPIISGAAVSAASQSDCLTASLARAWSPAPWSRDTTLIVPLESASASPNPMKKYWKANSKPATAAEESARLTMKKSAVRNSVLIAPVTMTGRARSNASSPRSRSTTPTRESAAGKRNAASWTRSRALTNEPGTIYYD